MANFEIINGKLVASSINEAVIRSASQANPTKAEEKKEEVVLVDGKKLQTNAINKLNSNLSLYSTGKSLYDAVQGGSILP